MHGIGTGASVGGGGGTPAAGEVPAGWLTHRELSWEEMLVEADRLGRDPRFARLSDAEVVERLSVGAAEIDAAMCRWLELLAELVIRKVWADQGARTPAVWLSWKLGIAGSTAREHVRVALRLREFPRVRDRFAAGTLSYSKVRALTRAGDPAFEELLLAWADSTTASALETVARGFRGAEKARRAAALDDEPDLRWSTRGCSFGDGTRELVVRGPSEVIAEIEDLVEQLAQVAVSERACGEPTERAATPNVSGDVSEDAEAGGDGEERDGGRPDPEGTADDLGDQRTGPSLRVTAEDRVEALRVAVAAAGADRTTVDTSGLDRHTLVVHVDARDLVAAEATPDAVVAVVDDHRRVRGIDRRTLRRLACDAGIVVTVTDGDGSLVDVGRRQRTTTAALRRAVRSRDRGCTFPGCGATRHLHAHHVQHWSEGGATDLSNLVTLCSFHHRFVHAHDWRIEVRADGRHRFRPVEQAATVAPIPALPGASAEAVSRAAPASASAEALRPPDYLGEPFDLDTAVAVLQQQHERARRVLEPAA